MCEGGGTAASRCTREARCPTGARSNRHTRVETVTVTVIVAYLPIDERVELGGALCHCPLLGLSRKPRLLRLVAGVVPTKSCTVAAAGGARRVAEVM